MARLWAGASGYSFKEWKGAFYPEAIKPDAMLAWYAQRLPTVEINNTFYQMPKASVLEHWAAATPEDFRFAIKASRRITHDARLKADAAADSVAYLYRVLDTLGAKRGPVLFQLPPFLKKDLPRLVEFLHVLPEGHRAAFEFRNDSWFVDEVYAALKAAGAALCLSEREDDAPPPLVETAAWGYVRLRLEEYSDADLAQWAARLAATSWEDVYVYFMHEPTAPGYAQKLMQFAPSPAKAGEGWGGVKWEFHALDGAGRARRSRCISSLFGRSFRIRLRPLSTCPAIGHSPMAFVGARAIGSQARLLTPAFAG